MAEKNGYGKGGHLNQEWLSERRRECIQTENGHGSRGWEFVEW